MKIRSEKFRSATCRSLQIPPASGARRYPAGPPGKRPRIALKALLVNSCHENRSEISISNSAPDMPTHVQKLSATLRDLTARSSFGIDAVLRMPLAIFYGVLAFSVGRALVVFVMQWPTLDIPYKGLRLASLLANAVFLFTLLSLTVLRSKPIRTFPSMNARVMAVLGLALPLGLSVLPEPDLPPA